MMLCTIDAVAALLKGGTNLVQVNESLCNTQYALFLIQRGIFSEPE